VAAAGEQPHGVAGAADDQPISVVLAPWTFIGFIAFCCVMTRSQLQNL
jgi:hypothetical protein